MWQGWTRNQWQRTPPSPPYLQSIKMKTILHTGDPHAAGRRFKQKKLRAHAYDQEMQVR